MQQIRLVLFCVLRDINTHARYAGTMTVPFEFPTRACHCSCFFICLKAMALNLKQGGLKNGKRKSLCRWLYKFICKGRRLLKSREMSSWWEMK